MIKIIEHGQTKFHGFCRWCGCEFTYEISDLKLSATSDKVSCPTCGKDYHHPSMIQDPTIPGGLGRLQTWPPEPIPCTPDMTKTDPCAGCAWRENLLRDGLYIGDTPCTWCNKNRFNSINCEQPSIKSYITPDAKQLDAYLSTMATSDHSNVKAYNKTENKEDITQGVVMSTIYDACCEGCTNSPASGKGLTSEHIVGNSNACYGSSCRNSNAAESHVDAKKRCRSRH
jgi:hypothetical protein